GLRCSVCRICPMLARSSLAASVEATLLAPRGGRSPRGGGAACASAKRSSSPGARVSRAVPIPPCGSCMASASWMADSATSVGSLVLLDLFAMSVVASSYAEPGRRPPPKKPQGSRHGHVMIDRVAAGLLGRFQSPVPQRYPTHSSAPNKPFLVTP